MDSCGTLSLSKAAGWKLELRGWSLVYCAHGTLNEDTVTAPSSRIIEYAASRDVDKQLCAA